MIAEVVRLDTEVIKQQINLDSIEQERYDLWQRYDDLCKRNEVRFDALVEKQTQIVDAQLGLGQGPRLVTEGEKQPIGRPNWRQVANKFEGRQKAEAKKSADEREKHWKKKITDVETADAKADVEGKPAREKS